MTRAANRVLVRNRVPSKVRQRFGFLHYFFMATIALVVLTSALVYLCRRGTRYSVKQPVRSRARFRAGTWPKDIDLPFEI